MKYLILCSRDSRTWGEIKWFLLKDDYGDTQLFDTKEEARAWCTENKDRPLAYVILCTDDFTYE